MIRIVVFGGRDYAERQTLFDVLDHLHARFGIAKLAHGGAWGADHHAEVYAVCRLGMRHPEKRVIHASWDDLSHPDAVIKTRIGGGRYDALAGHRRNQKLVDLKPDLAVQFPGGSGTADMRRRLDRAGIKVIQVYDLPHDWHVFDWLKGRHIDDWLAEG